ncbi:hypothetical protein ACFQ07_25620 [Actinomadura adrarensis]|uniref:Guanylate cyclase domain-containing protein n=1 Tax=Actinomadura adrarensis TaxID=1819600 RepID=A0ABW3CQ42_9ACTN
MHDPESPAAGGWKPDGHCTVFICDIVEFSRRPHDVQKKLRETLYSALESSLDASGLSWGRCRREDRGDGVIAVPSPTTSRYDSSIR